MDHHVLQSLTAATGFIAAMGGLIISLVALRLSREQARAYLFPVPALMVDHGSGGVVMRNLGSGAMLNVWVSVNMDVPGAERIKVQRHITSIAMGEVLVVVDPEIMEGLAVSHLSAQVECSNIRGRRIVSNLRLNASELSYRGER